MPQGTTSRSKKSREDTWNEAELKKSLKDATSHDKKRKERDQSKSNRKDVIEDDRDRRRSIRNEDADDKKRERRNREQDHKSKDKTARDHVRSEKDSSDKHREEKKHRRNDDERHEKKKDDERHEKKKDDERRSSRHRDEKAKGDKDELKRRGSRDEDRKPQGDREGSGRQKEKDQSGSDYRREKDRVRDKDRDRDGHNRKERATEDDGKRDKEHRRDREKERDHLRNKENNRSKYNDRPLEKDKDRDRDRNREKDREKDKDQKRSKHSDKDKERDKDKEHNRLSTVKDKEKHSKTKEEEETKVSENYGEENGYDDYEDDFEDYEDDFESDAADEDDNDNSGDRNDDDTASTASDQQGQSHTMKKSYDWDSNDPKNREKAEMWDAMEEENERLLIPSRSDSNVSYTKDSSDEQSKLKHRSHADSASGRRGFINFVSAKQREMSQQSANKTQRRYKELSKLIELDVAQYDIFELPPVKEYEMYIMNFGRSNTQQVYVQTNEDNMEREVQTDDIETKSRWSQHPADDFVACGCDDKDDDSSEDKANSTFNSGHLNKFIIMAGQAIATILEEELAEKKLGEIKGSSQSSVSFSGSFLQLCVPNFLKTHPVIYTKFSPVQTYLLLTVHSRSNRETSSVIGKFSVVCVWNVNEPSMPQKLLVCNADTTCCCFSPNKANLVFGGMSDGTVVVWDLRESTSLHCHTFADNTEWVLRYPTYSTAGFRDEGDNHHSSVTAIMPMVSTAESAKISLLDQKEATSDTSSGLSFQLVSLEKAGLLHIWVVAEISQPDEAGSESDLGLSPGGRVKLLKSATINLYNPLNESKSSPSIQALDLQLLPSDFNHFYVATDMGHVIHRVRHTGRAPPKSFHVSVESPVTVSCLDFSPFFDNLFLAGCDDGSLRLHNTAQALPLTCWLFSTNGCSIRCISWSKSRPGVFFVVDDAGHVYSWDLLVNESVPLKVEQVSKDSVTSFSLSNDHSATGLGLPGRQPQMVLSTGDGRLEVHNIAQQFGVAALDEVYQFKNFLDSL